MKFLKKAVNNVKINANKAAKKAKSAVKKTGVNINKKAKKITKKVNKKRGKKKEFFDNRATLIDKAIDVTKKVSSKAANIRIFGNKNAFKVKTWPTDSPDFEYPEKREPDLLARKDFGVAFSGGGLRSASCTIGALRALHEMGLESRVRYISCISGGSWAAVPYTYLPDTIRKNDQDENFLGKYINPENLETLEKQEGDSVFLNNLAKHGNAAIAISSIGSLAKNSSLESIKGHFTITRILNIFGKTGPESDESYAEALGRIIFRKFLLDEDKYMAWKEDSKLTQDTIKRRGISVNNFRFVEKDRPFLIVNGALNLDNFSLGIFAKEFGKDKSLVQKMNPFMNFYLVEFTPIYSGMHVHQFKAKNVGGGYIENPGWDSFKPKRTKNYFHSQEVSVLQGSKNHRLSLKDVVAVSGAAPAYFLQTISTVMRKIGLGNRSPFPEFNTWPVKSTVTPIAREMQYGDGGYCDNYGIIPQLKRSVKNIVVFINTSDSLIIEEEDSTFPDGIKVDSYLPVLFGQEVKNNLRNDILSPTNFLQKEGRFFGAGNAQVFDGLADKEGSTAKDAYRSVLEDLVLSYNLDKRTLKDKNVQLDRPLTRADLDKINWEKDDNPEDYIGKIKGVCYSHRKLKVIKNSYYGIILPYTANILFIYNESITTWCGKLPNNEIVAELFKAEENFPNMGTFTLKPKSQALKALSQLLSWQTIRLKSIIEEMAE